MPDALKELGAQPDVAQLCRTIQATVDESAWNRTLLRAPAEFWTLMRRECGYASAELDGATAPADPQQEPDDSPMGRVATSGLLVTAAADAHWSDFTHSPMQVWARLHALVDDGPDRGRPRITQDVHDPLHLGPLPTAADMQQRLHQLTDAVVHSRAPAVLVAAVAHAELAVLRPFATGSYLIARATPRMVLRGRGSDTLGAACLEVGQLVVGRARYVRAVQAYASGTRQGMLEYLGAFHLWITAGIERTQSAATILSARK